MTLAIALPGRRLFVRLWLIFFVEGTTRMTNRAKLRCLFAIQIAVIFIASSLFMFVLNWLTIISKAEAISRGMTVPQSWQYVTLPFVYKGSSGRSGRWPFGTIGEHPFEFGLSVFALIALIWFMTWIKRRADFLKKHDSDV